MKKIMSTIGLLGLTSAAFGNVYVENKNVVENYSNSFSESYHNQLIQVFSEEINNLNEMVIKNKIESLTNFESGKISFDRRDLKILNNSKIEEILDNNEFEIVLNELYNANQLIIQGSKVKFISSKTTQRSTRGLSSVFKWYWFGYGNILLDHKLADDFAEMISRSDGITITVNLVALIPELTSMAIELGYISLDYGYTYFKNLDHGDGFGFGSYGWIRFIPFTFFTR